MVLRIGNARDSFFLRKRTLTNDLLSASNIEAKALRSGGYI
jgi:hypothetical protein